MINLNKIRIFICFISKPCGVLTTKLITLEISVSTLITGKISEGSLNFIIILKINAIIGDQDHTLTTIERGARMNIIAIIVMDGKNKNIIQKIIN